MNDSIISLCYTSKKNGKTIEFYRIADYLDGRFIPYKYDINMDFYDTQRYLIYGMLDKLNTDLGNIAVYEWKVYQNPGGGWRTETHRSNVTWVEVVDSSCETLEAIVETVKHGWVKEEPFDGRHDIIICSSTTGSRATAVYIPKNALTYREGRLFFKEDVASLDTGCIDIRTDCEPCKCRYSPYDKRKYLTQPKNWHPTGSVQVKSTEEIIAEIVEKHIKRLDKDVLTKAEKRCATIALEKLSVPSVTENVAEALGCTPEQAQRWTEKFLAIRRERLNADTATLMVEMLIANDSSYVQTLKDKVAEEWEKQHSALLDDFKARIDAAESVLEERKQALLETGEELKASRDRLAACEKRAEEMARLQEEIEEQIRERLCRIHENYSAALVDEARLLGALREVVPSTLPVQASLPTANSISIEAPKISGDIPLVKMVDRIWETAEAGGTLCADEELGSALAVFLFAAYACRQPLVIAGESASKVADMFAMSICGTGCTKLYLTDVTNLQEVVLCLDALPHDFVCFVDALDSGYKTVRQLMDHYPDTQFILTLPHAESLLIEPPSLFTTFFPMLTDFFCAQTTEVEMESANCSAELRQAAYAEPAARALRTTISEQAQWFSDDFFAPLLKRRCARLQYCMKKLCEDSALKPEVAFNGCTQFLFVPLMKCLGKRDVISKVLPTFKGMDEHQRAQLLSFAGAQEE